MKKSFLLLISILASASLLATEYYITGNGANDPTKTGCNGTNQVATTPENCLGLDNTIKFSEKAKFQNGTIEVSAEKSGVLIDGMLYDLNQQAQTANLSKCPIDAAKNIRIPQTVTYENKEYTVSGINDEAFMDCTNIKSIELPNTIKSIGTYAFAKCKILRSINLPEGIETIGAEAFTNCEALTSIQIPEGISIIPASCFAFCYKLTSCQLPKSLTEIGDFAFLQCEILSSLTLKSTTPPKVADYTFKNINKQVQVSVPYGTLTAYKNAKGWNQFANITERTKETFVQDGITYEIDCVNSIASVKSCPEDRHGELTIPSSVQMDEKEFLITTISNSAFCDCIFLSGVTFPPSLTTIGDSAFYDCSGLLSLEFPASIESIGEEAFSLNSKLTKISSHGITPPNCYDTSFSECDYSIPFTVPVGTIEDYAIAPGWEKFTNFKEETSTSVNEVTDAPEFSVENGSIITNGPATIYNLAGQDVTAQNGSLKGIYILVQDGKTAKVMVK